MMWWRFRRMPKIYALLVFRNEMRFLPGYFESISGLVDGVIALDDGSTDGSNEFVRSRLAVSELITLPAVEPHEWNDAANHRRVVEASWRHDAGWVMALDADERLEAGFRERAEREIRRAWREKHRAYAVHVREMWDHPLRYRCDGIWGKKSFARFFEARRDHEFDDRRLHCHWAPLNSKENGAYPQADLNLYHLRMIDAADRQARRARYEALDPNREFQSIGYAYLTDITGAEFARIEKGREYKPLHA